MGPLWPVIGAKRLPQLVIGRAKAGGKRPKAPGQDLEHPVKGDLARCHRGVSQHDEEQARVDRAATSAKAAPRNGCDFLTAVCRATVAVHPSWHSQRWCC